MDGWIRGERRMQSEWQRTFSLKFHLKGQPVCVAPSRVRPFRLLFPLNLFPLSVPCSRRPSLISLLHTRSRLCLFVFFTVTVMEETAAPLLSQWEENKTITPTRLIAGAINLVHSAVNLRCFLFDKCFLADSRFLKKTFCKPEQNRLQTGLESGRSS